MYDVIVVGSGIAGGYLAQKLRGLDVLVLEKSKPAFLKDSGIVSSRFFDFIKVERLVEHAVTEMKAISPSGHSFSLNSENPFAYLLDRVGLSTFLKKMAARNAELRYEMVKRVEFTRSHASVITNEGIYDAKIVIGADGALSKVRASLGIKPPKMYAGIFVRTETPFESETDSLSPSNKEAIKVFFNKYYSPDFFSWIIPQNNEYGLITAIRPAEYFRFFKEKLNLPDGEIYSYLVPVGCTKSCADRALLVGEACGQVKPVSGGGIIFSLMAARHASRVIKIAFEKKRFDEQFLGTYERLWKDDLLWEIKMQLLFRNAYRWFTNKDIDRAFKDFGPHVEKARTFDYDNLSNIWTGLPKIKLLRYAFENLPYIFRG